MTKKAVYLASGRLLDFGPLFAKLGRRARCGGHPIWSLEKCRGVVMDLCRPRGQPAQMLSEFIFSPQPINLFHSSHLVELGHDRLDRFLILLLLGLFLIRVGDLLIDSSSTPPAVGCGAWWRKGALDTKSETML